MDTQLTWYGQSAFKIVMPRGKVLLVDPWLTNPVFEKAMDELAALNRFDLILVTIRGGPAIYHTGDTDLFSDMALLSRFHKIDFMLVCIGDHFTMGPARAAEAVRLVNPREVIPMHYGTFPLLTGTPKAFERELKRSKLNTQLRVMKIGETVALRAP